MADRNDIISRLSSRVMTKDEFNFERLTAPPLYSFIDQPRIDKLYNIASSVKYSGNARKKYKAMDEIMNPFGFKKLSAGTNRVVYKHLECKSIVMKVAADAVGLGDNPAEYFNQFKLKPFVTKTFEVDPSGVIGEAERVYNIHNREEFLSVAYDYYDLINNFIIGKYIMADIGTRYFMNIGIRSGFGIVLLDYPYLYELDGNKLYCQEPDPNSSTLVCGGIIDYDDGYNHLYCQKCGKRYRAKQLAKCIENKIIKVERRNNEMEEIQVFVNGVSVTEAKDEDGLLNKPTSSYKKIVDSSINDIPNDDQIVVKVNEKDPSDYVIAPRYPVIEEDIESTQSFAIEESDEEEEEDIQETETVDSADDEKDNTPSMTYEEAKSKYGEKIIEESEINILYQKALADLSLYEDKIQSYKNKIEQMENERSSYLEDKIKVKERLSEDAKNLKSNVSDIENWIENAKKELEMKDTTIDDLNKTIASINNEKSELIAQYNAKLNALESIINQKDDEILKASGKLVIDNEFSADNIEQITEDMNKIYSSEEGSENVSFVFLNTVFTSLNTLRRSIGQPEFEEDVKVLVPVDYNGNHLIDGFGNKIAMYTINNKFIDDIIDGKPASFPKEAFDYEDYEEDDEEEEESNEEAVDEDTTVEE